MGRKRVYKTPAARVAAHVARVKSEGGQRVTVLLSPSAAHGLQKLQTLWGCKTRTEVIERALMAAAKDRT